MNNAVEHLVDLNAEQHLLGTVLFSSRTVQAIAVDVGVQPRDFYSDRHQMVFEAMLALHAEDVVCDVTTISDWLARHRRLEQVGGPKEIDALSAWGGNPLAAGEYARIVKTLSRSRDLLSATYEIQAAVFENPRGADEVLAEAERSIFALGEVTRGNRTAHLSEATKRELDRIELASKSGRDFLGLSTGLRELDEALGGLHAGNLMVLAGRPSMGKSSVALQWAVHAAQAQDFPVLFHSLEMSESETTQRFLVMDSGIPPDRLRRGAVGDGDWRRLLEAGGRAHNSQLHLLDDPYATPSTLRGHARALKQKAGGLALIVVDYLQLMQPDHRSNNRVEDVSSLSRALKLMAVELKVPVVALSQLSRAVEQRPDKRPVLADLRESGSIEQDADSVLMLYRDDYYDEDSERPGEMDVLIRKHRHGALTQLPFSWLPERMRLLPLVGHT